MNTNFVECDRCHLEAEEVPASYILTVTEGTRGPRTLAVCDGHLDIVSAEGIVAGFVLA